MSEEKLGAAEFAAAIEEWKGRRHLGGGDRGQLNCIAFNQLRGTLHLGADGQTSELQVQAAVQRMAGIAPVDVVEAMLAAQLVATHDAAMECFRRARLPEQTFAGRELGLKYADKLVRSFAALAEALDRHRGKGQPQVVRVERVTVEAGGQAIVGAVARGGGGVAESEDQPHAPGRVTFEPEPEVRCPDPEREPVPLAGGDGTAALPDARRRGRRRRPGR